MPPTRVFSKIAADATDKPAKKQKKVHEEDTPALVHNESSEGEMSSDDETRVEDAFTGSAEEIKLTQKLKQRLSKRSKQDIDTTEAPGVVYLGRIPHGFYEDQMRAYFEQFGEVKRLRLSRNKKTGASKHYAFIEFTHSDVAQIVAETMDNYLLFSHTLKCEVIPSEKVHEGLWKGANRKFRAVPYAKLHRERHNKKKSVDEKKKVAKKLVEREQRLRQVLEEMGIDYEFPGYAAAASGKLEGEEKSKKEQKESKKHKVAEQESEAPKVAKKAKTAKSAKPEVTKEAKVLSGEASKIAKVVKPEAPKKDVKATTKAAKPEIKKDTAAEQPKKRRNESVEKQAKKVKKQK